MAQELTRQERLGLAIRTAREEVVDWTQQELADRIESSQSYISLLEKGRVDQPGMRLLSKIAYALNLDLNDLLVNSGWPDVSAYIDELQDAQEVIGGLTGRRVEIFRQLDGLPEDDAEKALSYTRYLREERTRYDAGPEPVHGEWRELFALAPKLPKEAARTFITMARLMLPAEEVAS